MRLVCNITIPTFEWKPPQIFAKVKGNRQVRSSDDSIENIDILLSISTRIVSLKKCRFLKNILILKNIAIYRDLFDNVVIFSTDFLLRNCVTEKRLQMGEVNGVKISQS